MRQRFVQQGFTLVELLVTIAIIAILAGILLPTVLGAFKKAGEAQARAEVKSLETALRQYYTEYGRFPLNNGDADQTYGRVEDASFGSVDNADIVRILRAIPEGLNNNHTRNPRRIIFLEVNESSLDEDNFVDPWGWQYIIALDTDFNNSVTPVASAGLGTLQGRTVAVFSFGSDQQIGTAHTNKYLTSWR